MESHIGVCSLLDDLYNHVHVRLAQIATYNGNKISFVVSSYGQYLFPKALKQLSRFKVKATVTSPKFNHFRGTITHLTKVTSISDLQFLSYCADTQHIKTISCFVALLVSRVISYLLLREYSGCGRAPPPFHSSPRSPRVNSCNVTSQASQLISSFDAW